MIIDIHSFEFIKAKSCSVEVAKVLQQNIKYTSQGFLCCNSKNWRVDSVAYKTRFVL